MNRRNRIRAQLMGLFLAVSAQLVLSQAFAQTRNCTREEYDVNADCRTAAPRSDGQSPKDASPFDLTGYWTSVVTEDWRWRMATAPAGDFASIPLNAEGQRAAKAWDPSKEVNDCKRFGAAGLLRNPTRLHLSWVNGQTLQLKTDHGEQTRTLHFGEASPALSPSAQGASFASWETPALKVVTSHLSPGYLRRNGIPYSERTRLTEYFNRYSAFGAEWLTVTTVVDDPANLSREFITSSHFKRLPDGSTWRPTPCGAG